MKERCRKLAGGMWERRLVLWSAVGTTVTLVLTLFDIHF